MRFGHHIGSVSARRRIAPIIGSGQSAGGAVSPVPATTGVFGGGAGTFFEDFGPNYQLGEGNGYSNTNTTSDGTKRVSHLWGNSGVAQHRPDWVHTDGTKGSIYMGGDGNSGVGLMTGVGGGDSTGFPQGLFEFCAKMGGGKGSGSGPALVIWPGSDTWINKSFPTTLAQEVDIGEIINDDLYFATHFYGPGWNSDDNGYEGYFASAMANPPPWKFWQDWHVYGGFLQADRLTYFLDGNVVAVDTKRNSRDFSNGGMNHAFGFMNRSWESTMECAWMRWTPEGTMIGKVATGGTTTPTPSPTPTPTGTRSFSLSPQNPGTRGAGVWNTVLTCTGMTAIKWVVQNGAAAGYSWTSDAPQVTVPGNGQVPIAANFNANDQFILYFDANDSTFQGYSGAVTISGVASPPVVTNPSGPAPSSGASRTLNVLLRGQSNAYLFADYGGASAMRDRIAQFTGRSVNLFERHNQSDPNTIYSGTEFLAEWMGGGTTPSYQENQILSYVDGLSAAQKAAPFVELWLHNESDQKVSYQYTTDRWVEVVRAEAAIMRTRLGLSAANHMRYFVPIRYPQGDITKIRAGMDQLAADSSFNARVSLAAWSLRMDNQYNPGGANGEHMGNQDALDLGENLAQELKVLFP